MVTSVTDKAISKNTARHTDLLAPQTVVPDTSPSSSVASPKAVIEPIAALVEANYSKLTTAKLAKKLGMKTADLNKKFVELSYLENKEGYLVLTEIGINAGGEVKKGKFGEFCLWNAQMVV